MRPQLILMFCTILLICACNVSPIEHLQSLCKAKDFTSITDYIASNPEYQDDINAKLLEDIKFNTDNIFSCIMKTKSDLSISEAVISEAVRMKQVKKIYQLIQNNNEEKVLFYLSKYDGEQANEILVKLLDTNLVSAFDLLKRMPQETSPQIRNLLLERYRSQVIVNIALEKKRDKLIQQARREENDTLVEQLLKDDKEEMLKQSAAIGDAQTVNLLLKMGAHPNNGALYDAIRGNSVEVVRQLLKAGAKLHTVSQEMILTLVRSNNTDMLNILLQTGARPLRDAIKKNEEVLGIAIRNNHLDLVNLLLQYGANPNSIFYGETALNEAIIQGNLEIVKSLVKHGANVNLPSAYSESLLDKYGYFDGNKMFTASRAGSLVWSKTATGTVPERVTYVYPLTMAYRHNEFDIVDFLLNQGAQTLQ